MKEEDKKKYIIGIQQSKSIVERVKLRDWWYSIQDAGFNLPEHKRVELEDIMKLAVQQEQERILKKAKAILYAEMEVYGTDKHGLSYEQLEEIIKK